jgi:hypothetical protein
VLFRSVSGNFNLGTDSAGVLYLFNKNVSLGTEIDTTPTPYTVTAGVYGAATIMGGINVFGNIYVGQPSAGAASPDPLVNSGNLYVQSGTPSVSSTSGAIVLAKVRMPTSLSAGRLNDGFSRGGLGMQGNLWAIGNVVLGGSSDVLGSGDIYSTVIVNSSKTATTTTSAALSVRGGLGVTGVGIFGGNIVAASTTAGRLGASSVKEGALVVQGGAYVTDTTVFQGNVVFTSSAAGAAGGTTVTGAIVLTGTNGIGVGGAASIGGVTKISDNSAGGSGTGALVVTSGGASIAGNVFVQGVVQPINAVGASGVVPVSATTDFTTTTVQAGGQDIAALNFFAEANKLYSFEAMLFHNTSAAQTKGFGLAFSAGTCQFVIEQNTSATGALSTVNYVTATATGSTAVATGAATGMLARITGTFTHTVATKVQVQAYLTATAGTLTVSKNSFFIWTKLT